MILPSNPNNLPPFEWTFQHLQVIGWPAICYALWKVTRYIDRITATATKTIDQIDKMATNCFPTMQASLQTQDELLKEIAQNTGRRRNTDFDRN
jgi:hypothetical protein